MPLWNEIEGQTLDGLTLRKLLRSEGRTAWFSTEDPDGEPAVVSVFEALNDEDTVLARLQAAARFQHPGLLVIRGTGAGRLGDESLVYALLEPFDQTLAEVLRVTFRQRAGSVRDRSLTERVSLTGTQSEGEVLRLLREAA